MTGRSPPVFGLRRQKMTGTTRSGHIVCRILAGLCALLLLEGHALAAPRIDVVIGDDAPALERFAADELAGQLKRLFDADVNVTDDAPADASHLILLGGPNTNQAIKALGSAWPKLSDQGHVLRTVKFKKDKALVVGGGSPVATLWAVYELGHKSASAMRSSATCFPLSLRS